MLFDNASAETRPISDTQSATTTIDVPLNLPTSAGTIVAVDIAADSEAQPSWNQPVRVYFRRASQSWTLVGLERIPERAGQGRSKKTAQ